LGSIASSPAGEPVFCVTRSCASKATLFKRTIVESAFVTIVILGTLFRQDGEVIWQWGILQIRTVGLIALGSVTCKVYLCLIALNILTMTTSIPELLNALASLRIPPLLIAILASMYRYLNVLIEEFNSMRRAAISRNFEIASPRRQRSIVGNSIGALFIRTYDRGERIYQAMLARGYREILPLENSAKEDIKDLAAISLTVLLMLLGQCV
jgi:cobalt/nickel transport system permease protein